MPDDVTFEVGRLVLLALVLVGLAGTFVDVGFKLLTVFAWLAGS